MTPAATADFDAWLSFAVGDSETEPGGEEGGLSWDTGKDNPTWRGLQYNEVCKLVGSKLTFDEFYAACTRTFIGKFTASEYWQRYRVDLLPSGPNVLFQDGCFNGGGVENLQTALNEVFAAGLRVDNDFGAKTLAAMELYHQPIYAPSQARLLDRYVAAADHRYMRLAQQPRFAPDLDGWRHRLRRCEDLAYKLADTTPPSAA